MGLSFPLDPFLGVQLGVDAEVGGVGKGLVAELTFVRPFSGVGVGVKFQVYRCLKPGFAELTLEAVLGAVLVWTATFPRWPTPAPLHEAIRREQRLSSAHRTQR